MEVRPAKAEDAAELAEVHAETWAATYAGNVPADVAHVRVARAKERDWRNHSQLRVRLGGGVLVLVDDGSVVGFCEYGPTEDEDDNPSQVGHIMRIFIRPTHQGRGGGKLLVAAACEHMAERGLVSAPLWTPEGNWNHQALDFYGHLGWAREEVRAPGADVAQAEGRTIERHIGAPSCPVLEFAVGAFHDVLRCSGRPEDVTNNPHAGCAVRLAE